ncbi:MAG: HNH endonuclease signature motif containing protein, partial [Gemmatimonadota bacterium]|nr:HNH endonuclease signature motif containing protein [Gemmatimonadota bacterium]
HWADGGETSLANLVLLCAHHHRLVHEGGWRVETCLGRLAFRDPRGQLVVTRPEPAPRLGPDPVAALTARTRTRGARPDATTAGARWRHEMEVPEPVWRRAMEAMARAEEDGGA